MYEKHWNLDKKPFENDQNGAFFFESKHHREARIRLQYGAEQRKPLGLLIGESGIGKTYVCRSAAAQLSKSGCLVAQMSATGVDGASLIRTAAVAFGLKDVPAHRAEALGQLTTLLNESRTKNTHPVLFIDNTECFIDSRCFDELRTLLDLNSADGTPLVTVILAGHPRVRGTLKRRHSFVQRLEVGYELEALDAEESAAYIQHRLSLVNAPEHLFDEGAIAKLVERAEGYPRLLNRLCDLSLLMGMIEKRDHVDADLVEDADKELQELKKTGSGSSRSGRGRDDEDDEDRSERGRGRGRGRGRDRERGGRDRERGGRDRERGGRDRERGRGRGRGRGRDRDRGRDNDADADVETETEGADDADYGFKAEDHHIQSMTEIIQGTLKQTGTGGRRRKRGRGKKDDDALQYFDSNVDEPEAEAEEGAEVDADASTEEPTKKRRRRRRGRGRKSEGETTETETEAGDEAAPSDDASTEDDGFDSGLDEAAPEPVAAKEVAATGAVEPDDFAAGLLE